MRLTFASPTLQSLDRVQSDVLVVGIFSDERPLRELAGLIDWRLNGKLSKVLQRRRFSATLGDSLLQPSGHRVGASRLLTFGLGDAEGYGEGRLAEAAEWIWSALFRLRAFRVAMPFPGGHRCAVPPMRAARLLVDAAYRSFDQEERDIEAVLFVRDDARKEIEAGLDGPHASVRVEFGRLEG